MDHLTRFSSVVGGMAPTGHHQRVVPIPRNSIEHSLRKLVKTFERDPTVGFIVMNLLTRFSSAFGGWPRPDAVSLSYRFDATPSNTASGNS